MLGRSRDDRPVTPVRSQRPQDLVFTLFGEYLLARSDFVWVGSLISLLEPLGLSEGAARTVLSRMAGKGWFTTERRGRASFYALTPRGRALLEEGQSRIYRPSWETVWDGRWFLLAYSIPQDARRARDRLRDRLAWLGFGSVGNGLWISARDVEDDVRELADHMALGEHLLCFRAERAGGLTDGELVERGWDLPDLNARYAEFATRWRGAAAPHAPSDRGPEPDADAFVRRFELIHEFRRFALDDPFLPRPLLPDPWSGDDATDVFRSLHDALVGPADRWVDEVLARSPTPPSPRS